MMGRNSLARRGGQKQNGEARSPVRNLLPLHRQETAKAKFQAGKGKNRWTQEDHSIYLGRKNEYFTFTISIL